MEITAGHVTIFPKIASGFADAIKQPIGVAGTAAGVLFGNILTKAVGAITAPLAGAFKGGFTRLMNIEQAEIKLRTLGLNVEAAMDSVSKSVDGTKFAISDAADMAAQLGSAGMDAGEGMTRWLSLTADAAQFSNRSFGEMQLLFQDIASQGRISGEVFNRFPLAVSALSEHLGVSAEEVRKLASQGKISADDFAAAIEGKIGGAAKNAGSSFLSLRDNIRTALNATAAHLIKPFVTAAMPIMRVGLDLAKGFRDSVAKPIGEGLTAILVPAADRFAAQLSKLPAFFGAVSAAAQLLFNIFASGDYVGSLGDRLGLSEDSGIVSMLFSIREAVSGLLAPLGGFSGLLATVSGVLPLVSGPLGVIGRALADVAPAFLSAMQTGAGFGDVVANLASGILTGFAGTVTNLAGLVAQLLPVIVEAITGVLPSIVSGITGLLPTLVPILLDAGTTMLMALVDAAVLILPALIEAAIGLVSGVVAVLPILIPAVIEAAVTLFAGLVQALPLILPTLLEGVVAIVMALIATLPTLIPTLIQAAVTLFLALVEALPIVLISLMDALLQLVSTVAALLPSLIPMLLAAAIQLFTALVNSLPIILPVLVQGAVALILAVVNMLPTLIPMLLNAAVTLFVALARSLPIVLPGLLQAVLAAIMAVLRLLPSLIGALIGAAVTLFMGLAQAVPRVWAALQGAISDLIGRAIGAIGGFGSRMLSSGQALIGDFVAGIRAGFDRAVGAVSEGLARVRSFFPFSPAQRGPFSGSGYVTHSGRALARDFGDAMAGEQSYLERQAIALTKAAHLSGTFGVTSAGVGGVGGGAGPGVDALAAALISALASGALRLDPESGRLFFDTHYDRRQTTDLRRQRAHTG